jgi:hypothetical protein
MALLALSLPMLAAQADETGTMGKSTTKTILATDSNGKVRREVYVEGMPGRDAASAGSPRTPLISFIDSPNVTCVQPDPRKDDCFVDWGSASVSASASQYIIAMSFFLNNRSVASVAGFFQTSMYVPSSQFGRGFKVPCGPPQAQDLANPCNNPPDPCTPVNVLGNAYSYTIRARETGDLKAANYGTVTCPAYLGARFYSLPPCRILDTRNTPSGPLAGPALQPSATRTFNVSASGCGIPSGAWAVSVNATITGPGAPGYVTLYPGGGTLPLASTINFSPGQTRANNAVVPLASDFTGTINVTNGSSGTVHLILDVNGYFK